MGDLQKIIERLNPYCTRALADALWLSRELAHEEILPEHWLCQLLAQGEGDLHVLAKRFAWDEDGMLQALLNWLRQQPHSEGGVTSPSIPLRELLTGAWLAASLQHSSQIRSVHLLMALVEQPSVLHCNSLFPLLSLGKPHLVQLVSLLDECSDERPMEQLQEALLMSTAEYFSVLIPGQARKK